MLFWPLFFLSPAVASPTWCEQAPSSTAGSFGWGLAITRPRLGAGGTGGAAASPPSPGSSAAGICVAQRAGRRLPGAQRWAAAAAAAGAEGPGHGCALLGGAAGGRAAHLWSQRFLLPLTDSQHPVAAWSPELISMRKGPPRTERCSRSSLQSCHTHPGFLSALP